MQVAVAAYSGPVDKPVEEKAKKVVRGLIGSCNPVLVLGGYRGLMRIVVDEALSLKGRVVLIIPREYEQDYFPPGVIVIRTGMDPKARSDVIVRSSEVLVALGGASGTLVEILMAYGLRRPVYMLVDTGLPSDRLYEAYPDGVLDPRIGPGIKYYKDPTLLAREACSTFRNST